LFKAAAHILVCEHGPVQFGRFRFAEQEFRPDAPHEQRVPDITEQQYRQYRPQREHGRIAERTRKLFATTGLEHRTRRY
jgi:hypothetical protein